MFSLLLLVCELAELQSQCPDTGASQDSAGTQVAVQGWTAEESWRIQIVHGASDAQLECVVSWWQSEAFPLTPTCGSKDNKRSWSEAKSKVK